ncbi:MAG: 3-alpha,7-alpha,12-alpha-trihydroxy-5-beta-cholest-24-enoyl-CoA hydratase [Gammaproteobacteria bacterium]|nr:3-alpha,7-alpha,12-alpha-trihydroxy-5-beta-cholest-24-enoyl-CoA hydratase [Gammaproteobacteria bacterium]
MAVVIDRLSNLAVDSRVRVYTRKDARFYALSVGFGSDPLDEQELDYVTNRPGFRSVPTMATIFADVIMDLTLACELERPELAVHGGQKLECFAPLPDEAELEIGGSITAIYDRGADRGAELHMVAEASLRGATEPLFRTTYVTIARGDGGFGGRAPAYTTPNPTPSSDPDAIRNFNVPRNQALFYSLNGDPNPIHTQPEMARRAGFDVPILHGLCTYGMACRAVLGACCDYDPTPMKSFDARFSAPVFPGETLVFELWSGDDGVAFQARSRERDVLVLKDGFSRISRNSKETG